MLFEQRKKYTRKKNGADFNEEQLDICTTDC